MLKHTNDRQTLNEVSKGTWACICCALLWLTPPVLANTDLNELGFDIFIDDPVETQKKEAAVIQNKIDRLPDFIDPEVWKEDLELDAPQVEPPKEPSWQGIYKQADVTDIGAESCCLRAARASRYQAETACLAMNHKVWEIRTVMPEQTRPPDAKLGNCLVYHQGKQLKDQDRETYMSPAETNPDEPGPSSFELDPYRCIARSMSKCYNPDQDP